MRAAFIISILFLFLKGVGQSYHNEWIDFSKTYYKIPVAEQRLYRIPKNTLTAAGLGNIAAEQFQLWSQGKQVPLYTTEATGPLAANGYIEFYGKPLDGELDRELFPNPAHHVYKDQSFFSDTSNYFLTLNSTSPNLRYTNAINSATTTTLPIDSFYMHTYSADFFRGGFSYNYNYGFGAIVGDQVVRSSVWDQGEGFASTPFNVRDPLSFSANNLRLFRNGPTMQVRHSVMGNWNTTRKISLALNDVTIDSVYVTGLNQSVQVINNIPLSRISLADGVKFTYQTSDSSYGFRVPQATSLYLTYPHRFYFDNNRITNFTIPANTNGNHFRIAAFATDGVAPVLYDETNLRRYLGILKSDSILFAIEPCEIVRKIIIANQTTNLIRTVNSLSPQQFKNYANTSEQGDYLIITNKRLQNYNGINYVNDYRDYRLSADGGGYNVKVIDVDELADQFSYGIRKHPVGIKSFIRYALNNFSTAPKYVLLLGRGSDYLSVRYSGSNPSIELLNAVPTWGSPGSDNLLVSTSANNPTPLVAIGRVSATNGNEIKTYLDKIKKYETLQRNPASVENNAWQKDVLQLVGGDDAFLTGYINSFMTEYSKIISDTLFGGKPETFKRTNNQNLTKNIKEITAKINTGLGLITYFGHTSNSSIDFGISNPEDYSFTNGRYPIFIANGCKAGNIFDLDYNRLQSKNTSLSDNYNFAANRGSIAFISNSDYGVIGYLDRFTNNWYKNAAAKNIGESLGMIQSKTVANTFALNPIDTFNRINLEQVILHADPAIKFFPYPLPDYATSEAQIEITPVNASVAADSLFVKIKFNNLGAAAKDSVWVSVKRISPNGKQFLLKKQLFRNLKNTDSVITTAIVQGGIDKGTNSIVASIDADNNWNETNENNNSATKAFEVSDEEIIPVFPYRFAIMNQPNFLLTGSTSNPLQTSRTYRLQVDTTELFNSTLLYTKDTTAIGGAIGFNPGIVWQNNRVYYWRLAPVINASAVNWRSSSFQYITGPSMGFAQSHYFQHKQSTFNNIKLTDKRGFAFDGSEQSLYAEHGIYNTSGTQDSHFSLSVNGIMNIYSACVGASLIFNLFDPVTFKQWPNYSGLYGSGPLCGTGREYNFEFSYYPASNRKKIMDFMDQIPKGTIVAVRAIVDPPHDSLQSRFWKNDTLFFGQNKSLYHSLFNQGFYDLDSLNYTKTFAFVFIKDDTTLYKPQRIFSAGLYDRILYNFFPETIDTSGTIHSPIFGPSLQWKQMQWFGSQLNNSNLPGTASVNLTGIDNNGNKTVLKTFAPNSWTNDISDLNAAQYPYLQFALNTNNGTAAIPYQLDNWKLFYTPVPDGALNAVDPNIYNKPLLIRSKDSLRIGLTFKNISTVNLGATMAKITVTDENGNDSIYYSKALKTLAPNDTAFIYLASPIINMTGRFYSVHIEVNAGKSPVEQHWFNNNAWYRFEITDQALPISILEFTANAVKQTSKLNWLVTGEKDVQQYILEHSTDNFNFSAIALLKAVNTGIQNSYQWLHTTPAESYNYYRLKIVHNNGTVEYSGIRKLFFNSINVISLYPNPFQNSLQVKTPISKTPFDVEIYDAKGSLVLRTKVNGIKTINTSILISGIYLIKVSGHDMKTILKIQKQ